MTDRISTLRASFPSIGIDALLVTSRTNVRYLSGFTGSAGSLVIGAERASLFTDSRYAVQAPLEIGDLDSPVDVVVTPSGGFEAIVDALGAVERAGVEAEDLSWATADRLRDAVDATVVATTAVVENLREYKDTDEIERIREAAAMADAALDGVRPLLLTELTEREFARALESAMLEQGADRPAFDTIVATGLHAARPHHQPGTARITAGDLVVVDFGAEHRGYRSDMTRTFVIGQPSSQKAELLEAVEVAQAAGVAAAGPGVPAAEVDAACRAVLADAGLGDRFTHGTGHGVGIDIHEAPSVSATSTATLAAGHVITVEPGVYLPEVGGVRWEDTLVITADGAEPLTRSAKAPIIT